MEWIPVKDKLPEESDRYIVSLESGWVGPDYFEERDKSWEDHAYRVVAWMPFPKKYVNNS